MLLTLQCFFHDKGILFFDELNRCPEKVQNALLQVLEEGKATIGSYDVDFDIEGAEIFHSRVDLKFNSQTNQYEYAGEDYGFVSFKGEGFMGSINIKDGKLNELELTSLAGRGKDVTIKFKNGQQIIL
ncbi:AAA family ATPase, partial [archaeon]|nr:AAA family ATPase [archaeon]